jgi:hypothetical protein
MLDKQTAVEWLENKLDIIFPLDFEWDKLNNIFQQAKQMEKKQITDAYTIGRYQQRMDEFLEINDIISKNKKKD